LGPDSICDKNDPKSDEEQSEFQSCTEFEDDLTKVEIDKREIARSIPHDKVNTNKPDPEGIKIETVDVEIDRIGISCHNCGKPGHMAVDCRSKPKDDDRGNQAYEGEVALMAREVEVKESVEYWK
jgi:Zinc knuckle